MVENAPDRVTITTQQTTGFWKRCVYQMARTANGWRIANRWYVNEANELVDIDI